MKNSKKLVLCIFCMFLFIAVGCSSKESPKKEEESLNKTESEFLLLNLTGNYHAKDDSITIQITDENTIIFKEKKQGNLQNLMDKLIKEKMQAQPQQGFMEELIEGMQSGCEFTRTETELIFYPVPDDSFALKIKYFQDKTIAFLNESYEKE